MKLPRGPAVKPTQKMADRRTRRRRDRGQAKRRAIKEES